MDKTGCGGPIEALHLSLHRPVDGIVDFDDVISDASVPFVPDSEWPINIFRISRNTRRGLRREAYTSSKPSEVQFEEFLSYFVMLVNSSLAKSSNSLGILIQKM